MAKFSNELLNKLTEFLVCEIGSKSLSGITYTMMLKDEKDKALYERCKDIKKECLKCGYSNDEVFRIYDVSNGYVFDMDLSVAKKISTELTKAVEKTNNIAAAVDDAMINQSSKRRKDDMLALAKFIKQEFEAGKTIVEVALFSRNSVPRIVISGEGPNGQPISIKYSAYAIRHIDIEHINANVLIPGGIRVAKLTPMEILPSLTGVSFRLEIERV